MGLNVMFCLSVIGSVAGLQQLVQLKSATRLLACPSVFTCASAVRP